jgi:flagellar hook protein FlgE
MSMEISQSGLRSARRLQLQSARKIASASQEGGSVNMVDQAMNQSISEQSFTANAVALKTQNEMMGTLLDVLA